VSDRDDAGDFDVLGGRSELDVLIEQLEELLGEGIVDAEDALEVAAVAGLAQRLGAPPEALASAVAGLAFSACRVVVTWPGSQGAMWMLLVCSTPPRSDLLVAPLRRRLSVVSLFPKAWRKA
jgi:hypothetical protein